MTVPLVLLAMFAVLLGFHRNPRMAMAAGFSGDEARRLGLRPTGGRRTRSALMLASSLLVFAGLGLGWWIYGRRPIKRAADADALERLQPALFHALHKGLYIDQLYALTILRLAWWIAIAAPTGWTDGSGAAFRWRCRLSTKGVGLVDFSLDRWVVNKGFDEGCNGVADGGRLLARLQDGRIQNYLRLLAAAVAALAFSCCWDTEDEQQLPLSQRSYLASFRWRNCGSAARPSRAAGSAADRRHLRHRGGCVYGLALVPFPACAGRACNCRKCMRGSRRLGLPTTSAWMA